MKLWHSKQVNTLRSRSSQTLCCALFAMPAAALAVTTVNSAEADTTRTPPAQSEEVRFDDVCRWFLNRQSEPRSAPDHPTELNIGSIKIKPHAIFAEDENENLWIHRTANWLHLTTKDTLISRELILQEGQTATAKDLAEAERLLRAKSYLRDAKITVAPECNPDGSKDILVETWDNWSLLPTLLAY